MYTYTYPRTHMYTYTHVYTWIHGTTKNKIFLPRRLQITQQLEHSLQRNLFLNLVDRNKILIVITHFRLIWIQTGFRLYIYEYGQLCTDVHNWCTYNEEEIFDLFSAWQKQIYFRNRKKATNIWRHTEKSFRNLVNPNQI